jgi:hypothetical protein
LSVFALGGGRGLALFFESAVEAEPGPAGGGLLAADLFPDAVGLEVEFGFDVGALMLLHGAEAEAVEQALEASEVGGEGGHFAHEESFGGEHEGESPLPGSSGGRNRPPDSTIPGLVPEKVLYRAK